MACKKFRKQDGYIEKDFLHFGYDHIDTGLEILNNGEPCQFDSAGYLIHLGLELILKAWHLHSFDYFTDIHDLNSLIDNLSIGDLSKENLDTISMLNKFYLLRYPRAVEGPIEIGQDDIEKIEHCLNSLWKFFPGELRKIYQNIEPLKKGRRITMQKKILDK